VDGIAGESNVYKRRGTPDKKSGLVQHNPKHITFVLDCSASMARFNGWDKRLDKQAHAVTMLLEALEGFEHKFRFSMLGHAGSRDRIPLFRGSYDTNTPPRIPDQTRLDIVQSLYSYARGAPTGDATQASIASAMSELVQHDRADDRLVIALSDANLGPYGISPEMLSNTLLSQGDLVQAYVVFLGDSRAANWLVQQLPVGRAFVCADTKQLPAIIKDIFVHATASGK
jgi:von Willebrand factor A domain-containing protein 8